jgi:hypothetical protein
VDEAERNIELNNAKRRLYSLEIEFNMEKEKGVNIVNELEAKEVCVKELNQTLCDVRVYARTQIHQLESELALHKSQNLGDNISDLPALLRSSDEAEELQRKVDLLTSRLKFQEEHLNLQKESYESLRMHYNKLKASFKHPNLVALVSSYRKQVKWLKNELGSTTLDNKSLRKQIAEVKSCTHPTSIGQDFIQVNGNNASVTESATSPFFDNDCKQEYSSSCINQGEFSFSLDRSPSSSYVDPTSPHSFEAKNYGRFTICLDSSPTSSDCSSASSLTDDSFTRYF